jgi:hypothetical protein
MLPCPDAQGRELRLEDLVVLRHATAVASLEARAVVVTFVVPTGPS